MHHIALVDGRITEKDLFRMSSCLSHSPGYQSLEKIGVNLRLVSFFAGIRVFHLRLLFPSTNVNMKLLLFLYF